MWYLANCLILISQKLLIMISHGCCWCAIDYWDQRRKFYPTFFIDNIHSPLDHVQLTSQELFIWQKFGMTTWLMAVQTLEFVMYNKIDASRQSICLKVLWACIYMGFDLKRYTYKQKIGQNHNYIWSHSVL